ncbi:MAG: hypothetical protein ABL949_07660 [Fimbriimonadaceae bacterium]
MQFERTISPHAYGYLPVFGEGPLCADAHVSVEFKCTPVTIESWFAVRTEGEFNFLIGQEADFLVESAPYTAVGHQWTPSAHCFRTINWGVANANNEFFLSWVSGHYFDSRKTFEDVDLIGSNPSVVF